MGRFVRVFLVALVTMTAVSAVAITARALYLQETNQLTTRANPVLSTEGMALTLPAAYPTQPTAVSTVQFSVSLNGVSGSLPDAGPPTLPDAGPDYLTGGSVLMWRYNPTAGWFRVPSMDCQLGMYALPDAGIGFADGGAASSIRMTSWACPEQVISVIGPSDRIVAAGSNISTAMTSPVDTVNVEGVLGLQGSGSGMQ